MVKIHPSTRAMQIRLTVWYSRVLVWMFFPLHKQNSGFRKRCYRIKIVVKGNQNLYCYRMRSII